MMEELTIAMQLRRWLVRILLALSTIAALALGICYGAAILAWRIFEYLGG